MQWERLASNNQVRDHTSILLPSRISFPTEDDLTESNKAKRSKNTMSRNDDLYDDIHEFEEDPGHLETQYTLLLICSSAIH